MNTDWEVQLRKKFGLDSQQIIIAVNKNPTKSGYRRVRGAAGSGKSLTLAARAAVLASEAKKVLVSTYNKTLPNYLSRDVQKFRPEGVSVVPEIVNFHKWCSTVSKERFNDFKWDYHSKYGTRRLDDPFWWKYLPKRISEIYEQNLPGLPFYDAILVDEGHDFDISGWQALRKALKAGGEMLLVCDKTQDIYGNAHQWTNEAMSNCGFESGGRWMELKISYRLPSSMIPILEDYLQSFPFEGEREIPKGLPGRERNLFDDFRWIQVSDSSDAAKNACIREIERLHRDPDIPTVYFITGKVGFGKGVAKVLSEQGIDILDTYFDDARKRDLKPGCADICATTIQSFKGWEASHLVIHLETLRTDEDRKLFYTALSRLKDNNATGAGASLTVVSSCPEAEEFGRKHFKFEDRRSAQGQEFDIPF